MIKTKFSMRVCANYLLVILLLSNGFLYAQEVKDYKQIYSDLVKDITTERDYQEKTSQFFNSLDNKELPLALADISKGEDANFVAYKLFIPNKNRFDKKEFRKNMLEQLSLKSNTSEFKIVLIKFISKYRKKDDAYVEELNDELFKIANTKDNAEHLRSYAASKYGISKDFDKTHKNLKELFNSDNLKTKTGTAKAIRKFLYTTKISDAERSNWEDLLILEIEKNKENLEEVSSMLNTLSQTKTQKSKKYLLYLFEYNVINNPEAADKLVFYLSNEVDTEILNKVLTGYSKHEYFKNFGSELKLKRIVNENEKVVEELYNDKNEDSKINYLRAVKHVKVENRKKFLNNVKKSLSSNLEVERLECVRSLHFLLPYEEEVKIFKQHLSNEKSDLVKNQIYFYIGE